MGPATWLRYHRFVKSFHYNCCHLWFLPFLLFFSQAASASQACSNTQLQYTLMSLSLLVFYVSCTVALWMRVMIHVINDSLILWVLWVIWSNRSILTIPTKNYEWKWKWRLILTRLTILAKKVSHVKSKRVVINFIYANNFFLNETPHMEYWAKMEISTGVI